MTVATRCLLHQAVPVSSGPGRNTGTRVANKTDKNGDHYLTDRKTPALGKEQLSVLLVDDHALIGESLAASLPTLGDFQVRTAMNIAEALEAIATHGRFDVVLLDYALPGTVGFEGLQRVLEANGAGVVLFSGHVPSNVIDRALAMGAMGYIPKTTALKTLENALRLVAGGAAYVPVEHLLGPKEDAPQLKPREMQILQHVCAGQQNKEIAFALGLSEVIVKADVKAICRKLGVRNRTEAALKARQDGLV